MVGVRSGTLLDPELVAELRAVAARTDVAQRALTILEPSQGTGVASHSRSTRTLTRDSPAACGDASDGLEDARCYRSSGASQRCGEYLSIELADNTTSKFLR